LCRISSHATSLNGRKRQPVDPTFSDADRKHQSLQKRKTQFELSAKKAIQIKLMKVIHKIHDPEMQSHR
jgi:hypothetical protein